MRMIKKVIDVAYHRNGVSGRSFNVVLFVDRESKETMVGILPYEETAKNIDVECYVLSVDKLKENDIVFASNSYRGDNYAQELREAIQKNEEMFENVPEI